MKRILFLTFLLINIVNINALTIKQAFEHAYKKYPLIPVGTLEALAYANSHLENLAPTDLEGHNGMPAHYGLFALVENGKGYFKNNLLTVCEYSKISIDDFKKNPDLQISSIAAYLNYLINTRAERDLKVKLVSALCDISEIPNSGEINQYARNLYAYEVLQYINNGFTSTEIALPSNPLNYTTYFDNSTLEKLKAPSVSINNRTSSPNVILSTDYPPALWVAASASNSSSRGTTAISAVTIHTVQGTYAGCISWFQNATASVSAHYVIRSSDGQVTQMVLESGKAWHVGSENPYTIGIEHEGYVTAASWYTNAMYTSSANLVKDICTSRGITPSTCFNGTATTGINVQTSAVKIKGHQHYPNQTHTDPGVNWNWTTYYNLINGTPVCSSPTTPASSNVTYNSATLAWAAVSGVSSYNVRVKVSGSATWTTYNTTTATKSLTGLSASTIYECQLQNVCSSTLSSAFSSSVTFTTSAAPTASCGLSGGLIASGISTTKAKVSWNAVVGAINYTLRYKPVTSSTWLSYTTTSKYRNLTSLQASTSYEYQVMANCSLVSSSYTASANFSTQALCWDPYESNNTSSTATTLVLNSTNYGVKTAKICASGDIDWYVVNLSAINNIKFSLYNLPADFNVELYVNGAYVTGSYNTGTTADYITVMNQPAGSYYFRVYGQSGASHSSLDYSVSAKQPTITARLGDNENSEESDEVEEVQNEELSIEPIQSNEPTLASSIVDSKVFPNPVNGNKFNVSINNSSDEKIGISVYNLTGQVIYDKELNLPEGVSEFSVEVPESTQGFYYLKLTRGSQVKLHKMNFIKE